MATLRILPVPDDPPPQLRAVPDRTPTPRIAHVLNYLEKAELKEIDPHKRSDLRISWLTVKWASQGIPDWCVYSEHPFDAAVHLVLHMRADQVWPRILAERRAKLGGEYSDWYDDAGNWRPEMPNAAPPPLREAEHYDRLPTLEHINNVVVINDDAA